ncbi:hypothetical protein GYA28_01310 [Candidatus Roizmanbacteria bacterium]|jgi:hypothetical protein|nr:hypothetical protein [Candidatus Roizmanbacteria bacterium]
MNGTIDEKVSVITSFDKNDGSVTPQKINWQGRDYVIKTVSYHHRVREGKKLLHIFHVTDGGLDFRLRFDTENLHWTLEEIYDESSA